MEITNNWVGNANTISAGVDSLSSSDPWFDGQIRQDGGKIVNDPIHGHILLPPPLVTIMDTPQFQRLRDLKQLGTSYFVFPGASHNRFEHSVGVGFLSGNLLERFKMSQPELDISDREVQLVGIAGLCHDLGHGPFSHAFEEWIHRWAKLENTHWHHEDMSVKMLRYLIDENNIECEPSDVRFIEALISGHSERSDKAFLYEIVSNSKNSIDVDKFDYLSRDCYNLGMKTSYDSSRLMKFSRVINGEICFHSKEVYNVYEMFHTRYSLHKMVYSHRVSKAIEYMIADAMTEADSYLGISKSLMDAKDFCVLTDSILNTIEYSKAQELEKARGIVKNIRRRKLYKFADESIIPNDRWNDCISKLNEEEVLKYRPEGSTLQVNDIILQQFKLNYAMKDKNPVDNVYFFSRFDQTESFKIPKEQVSLLIPDQFSECYLRVFVRNPDKVGEAQTCFRSFLRQMKLTESRACLSSPPRKIPKTSSMASVSTLTSPHQRTLLSPSRLFASPSKSPSKPSPSVLSQYSNSQP